MEVDSEREDGEIVDGLEEVSDVSIASDIPSGKSVGNQDIMSVFSVSSSEGEWSKSYHSPYVKKARRRSPIYSPVLSPPYEEFLPKRTKRKRKLRDLGRYGNNKRRLRSRSSSSSDSEVCKLDEKTTRKLKEAVRINKSHNSCQIDLQTRLINMNVIKPVVVSEEDIELSRLREDALSSTTKQEEESVQDNGSVIITNDPMDLESSSDDNKEDLELQELRMAALKTAYMKKCLKRKEKLMVNGQKNETNKENAQDNLNTDKSECVKAETNLMPEIKVSTPEEDIDIMRAELLSSISKKITSTVKSETVIEKSTNAPLNNFKSVSTFTLLNSVQPVVKKQPIRPPVTAKVKPLIIQVNADSDSDTESPEVDSQGKHCSTIEEFLKKTRAQYEKSQEKSKSVVPNTSTPVVAKPESKISLQKNNSSPNVSLDSSLNKSIVKYMPKSKLQEYQLLKQRLKNITKKRLRRMSQRNLNEKLTESGKHVLSKYKIANGTAKIDNINNNSIKFKEIRLQSQGKYKELAPLLRKIDEAQMHTRACGEKIKKLLEDVKSARLELSEASKIQKELIQLLDKKKNEIDARFTSAQKQTVFKKVATLPAKPTNNVEMPQKKVEQVPVEVKSEEIETIITPSLTVVKKEESVDVTSQSGVPKYISPLTHCTSEISSDPLATLCPFQLFGECKDSECGFKHS